MSRRTKIILAVIVLLLLLLLGALFLLRSQPAQPVTPDDLNGGTTTNHGGLNTNFSSGSFNTNVSGNPAHTPPPAPPKVDERNNLRATAKSFAELFGSFSTEGNFQNIVDAEFYMTPTLKTWAEGYVADARSKPTPPEFSGTTTRSISTDITAFDEKAGTASATVKTQRRETGSTTSGSKVYYQDLKLEFIKIGTAWKVNVATWQPV